MQYKQNNLFRISKFKSSMYTEFFIFFLGGGETILKSSINIPIFKFFKKKYLKQYYKKIIHKV